MQQPLDKQFIDLRLGLITEAGYLNTPEGATIDEENFRILVDGSRKRRRGLDLETGGSNIDIEPTMAAGHAVRAGSWANAGGDPDSDLIALQIGGYLYFYKDTETTLSGNKIADFISLGVFATTATATDYTNNPVSFASGNGILVVCGRYIDPFYLEYDPGTESVTATKIEIYERDFHTIEEGGVSFSTQPASLTEAHEYNLRNRGWRDADITTYETDKSKYPALGMLWYKGYARQVDGTTYVNEDGVKAFNSDKMEAEPFGNASAPTGSLLVNPFDTTTAFNTAPVTVNIVGDWTHSDVVGGWEITLNTVSAHGATHPAEVTVTGQESRYVYQDEDPSAPPAPHPNTYWSFDGTYTTDSVTDTDTLVIIVTPPLGFDSWTTQYYFNGVLSTGGALENNSDGYTTNERPTVCGWFAGRAWFTGINHPALLDRIYFSKLQYPNERTMGKCYQQNDPTDEVFNALLPDDGGSIVISDMGRALGFLDYNGSWLVFTNEGVWEIRGDRGVFTADNYNIRKLSDNECTSPFGFFVCENVVVYTGTKGIFTIQPEPQTGILYAQSISLAKIQSLWNALPQARQRRARVRYDDANKQVYILVSDNATDTYKYEYNTAFVFDLRLGSWCKMTFPAAAANYIFEAWPIKSADVSEQFRKMKFFVQTSTGTVLKICDMDQTDYVDFDGNEKIPYMIMAYDNIGTWSHYRQSPKIHVFMKKTETGFTEEYDPVNESSLTMQARWDWSDHANANEWGSEIEVYKHRRPYIPSGPSDTFDTGYPVVVTRNKVRGRGRSLHLKFTGTETKDAHILGYAVRYAVGSKV